MSVFALLLGVLFVNFQYLAENHYGRSRGKIWQNHAKTKAQKYLLQCNVYIFLMAWVQAILQCDFEWADVKQAKRFMKMTKCRLLLMRHKMHFKMWKMKGTYYYQCIAPHLLQKSGSDFL